jgi:hypothetical protein
MILRFAKPYMVKNKKNRERKGKKVGKSLILFVSVCY